MRVAVFPLVGAILFASAVCAQSNPGGEQSNLDPIWRGMTEWYADPSNPAIQRVSLSGRFHYDFASIDSESGMVSEWNVRRLRIGPRITFLNHLTLHSEIELDPQRHDPFYVRFTDFYLQWSKHPRLVLTVGKQGAPFTLDGATSSRELLTIDRSNLANNLWFPQEYLPGVSVSGRIASWVYRGGAYSAGESNRKFGRFNGGIVLLGVVGYDFADRFGAEEAVLTGNYVYQHPNERNTFTRQLRDVGSINFRFEDEAWGFRVDAAAGNGYLGQPDLAALQAMPFVNLTSRLQVVGRYTWIDSDGVNGIRLALYESRVIPGRGDRFNELYLGANYYFYGHRLKLQSGLQFADLNDRADDGGAYSGTAWTTGLRVGW